ncbi:MAG: ketoacyl-ACP synthase III [Syntrophus sp. (in: bacteria)]|nr:ketoacyl-ACP synthase III [Syntrophus sp. (in: bacteria)]
MLYLHGLGHDYPQNVITNRFLEDLDIGASEDWILERVGIRTRRTSLPLDYIRQTKNSDLRAALDVSSANNITTGAAAARMAIKRAGISADDIGLVISGSSAPDTLTPAEASMIACELGIECPCFDLNSACTTFGMQIHFLSGMAANALPPFILLVNPENLTRSIDYSDRSTAVLFGDGSAAAVVSANVPSRMGFTATHCGTRTADCRKVVIPRTGYFQQDGSAVQGFAIRKATDSIRLLQMSFPAENGHRFLFVGHQANLGMLRTVCERAGITPEHHWHNVVEFGNTGASGAPAVLSRNWDRLRAGDHVAMALVGGGLTWVHLILKVEERP